ncbi:hypothetical protein HDV00_012047 [Rhizophlyctis rosea]|nr:hypothetical protein HDV00_012047 [Rhizophlyctis rosea]
MSTLPSRPVVILGGGVIGAATAYHLHKLGMRNIIIVEKTAIACAASGKAGGFLARNWSDQTPKEELARVGFALHAETAKELKDVGIDVGYRPVWTFQGVVEEGCLGKGDVVDGVASRTRRKSISDEVKRRHDETHPTWASLKSCKQIGTPTTTAQVHPKLLTEALVRCSNANVIIAEAIAMVSTPSPPPLPTTEPGIGPPPKRATHVKIRRPDNTETLLPCDTLIFALGPWSSTVRTWNPPVPIPEIGSVKAHTVIHPPSSNPPPPHCLFLTYKHKDESYSHPEVYPRPDGTVYTCHSSPPDYSATFPTKGDIVPTAASISDLIHLGKNISSLTSTANAETATVQTACFYPTTSRDVPVIGALPGYCNTFIATGHSCWGILFSLSTGKALAELIVDGKSESVDLKPFAVERFRVRERDLQIVAPKGEGEE